MYLDSRVNESMSEAVEKKFLEALEDLEGTLIRMGHSDYPEWCEKWIGEEKPD